MVTPFVGIAAVDDYAQASRADTTAFARVHRAWRRGGVLWPPSQFETAFVSTAHTGADIDRAIEGFAAGLATRPSPALSSAAGPPA
jgi:glutamate-1-semialdehyde 2,1-aminomutase